LFYPYLDASALAKRYVPEAGSPVVDHLFVRVPLDRMFVLAVGMAEVVSILVRKHNAGAVGTPQFRNALRSFRAEFQAAGPARPVTVAGVLAESAYAFIEAHSLNSTDAILLRSALDLATTLRPRGDDLFLAASDRRLLKAAQAEGLTTFNPDTQSEADLDTLLGP
jgi:predicted nucleic acid-binding protein